LDSILAAALSDLIFSEWLLLWMWSAAPLLLASSRTVRARAACYVFRDLLELDAESPRLLYSRVAGMSAPLVADDECSVMERQQWALVMIARAVRDWASLAHNDLDWVRAARTADPETRVALLEVVALGSAGGIERTVDRLPLTDVERYLSRTFLCSASVPLFELRKRATRAFSILLARAASTASNKDAAAGVIAADAAWVRDVIDTCAACVYPGAPSDRVALPLEILGLALRSGGGADSVSRAAAGAFGTHAFAGVLLTMLCEPAERTRLAAAAVLIALGSRSVEGSVCGIAGFSTPSEVSSLVDWAALLTASPRDREAAGGAAAFRVLHAVYARAGGWCAHSFLPVRPTGTHALTPPPADFPADAARAERASRSFALALCNLLGTRTRALRAAVGSYFFVEVGATPAEDLRGAVDAACSSATPPLAHGVATALRTVILDSAPPTTHAWRLVIARALDELSELQRAALVVVANANASEGDGDAGEGGSTLSDALDEHDDEAAQSAEGESAAEESLELTFAGRVDARKRLVGPVSNSVRDLVGKDVHAAARGSASTADLSHAVVVAAWLSTREAVRAQADIIAALKLPSNSGDAEGGEEGDGATADDADFDGAANDADDESACAVGAADDDAPVDWLVSGARVTATLRLLVSSLMELRHVGSIAATADALRTVASRLLTRGDVSQRLARAPARSLRGLLCRLSSGGAFILRRSAGFGYAVAAILHAEPSNVPARLLPTTLRALLDLAAPADATAWRASVHARHVLALLFKDAALGSDVSPWCGEALRAALAGFASRAWAVRNSSHMLFGAVIDRGLGMSKNAPDARADAPASGVERHAARVSLATLESSLPGARAAALAALLRAPDAPAAETFPAVLLLMRCAADDADDEQAGGTASDGDGIPSRRALVDALLPLLSAKHGFVRSGAAAAIGGLMSRTDVGAVCALARTSIASESGDGCQRCANTAHGALVALRAALREAARRHPVSAGNAGVAAMRAALALIVDVLPATAMDAKLSPFVRAEALSFLSDFDKGAAASAAAALLDCGATHLPVVLAAAGAAIGAAAATGWVQAPSAALAVERTFLRNDCAAEAAANAFALALQSSPSRVTTAASLCPLILKPLVTDALACTSEPLLRAALVTAAAALATTAPRKSVLRDLDTARFDALRNGASAARKRAIESAYECAIPAVRDLASRPSALASLLTTATCDDAAAAEAAWRILGSGVAAELVRQAMNFPEDDGVLHAVSALGEGAALAPASHSGGGALFDSSSGGATSPFEEPGFKTKDVRYDSATGSPYVKAGDAEALTPAAVTRTLRAFCRAAAYAANGAVFSLRADVARALGDSCIAQLPLSSARASSAARKAADVASLEFAWPTLLNLAVDADDQVREAARSAIAASLGFPSNALAPSEALKVGLAGGGAVARNAPRATINVLRCGDAEKLSSDEPAAYLSGLLRDSERERESAQQRNLSAAAPSPSAAIAGVDDALQALSSDAIFLAAHEALLVGAQAGGPERVKGVLKLAGERAAAPLNSARTSILAAVRELADAGRDQNVEGGTAGVARSGACRSELRPFDPTMLARAAFLPAAEGGGSNDFSETLVTGGLAAGLWRALTSGPSSEARMPLSSLSSLLGGATALIAAASDDAIAGVLDGPAIVRAGAWVPAGAADSHPDAFAAARIAEALLLD
jgi:hypothetical protein